MKGTSKFLLEYSYEGSTWNITIRATSAEDAAERALAIGASARVIGIFKAEIDQMIEKARRGKIVGGKITFGYDLIEGMYAVNQQQAVVVRQIFEWSLDGLSISRIAEKLNVLGLRPHTAKRWAKSTVFRILKNETYAGVAYYCRTRRLSIDSNIRESRPQNEWVTVPVPAIVSREIFDKATQQLALNRDSLAGRPLYFKVSEKVKTQAQKALRSAVRSGRIEKKPCERCGAEAQGHHEDYSQPLDVLWLCPKHHGERHMLLVKYGTPSGWPEEVNAFLSVKEIL